ncbi:MAG: WecB/TagA/CpsF family glycosyltransferase [Muribaculaceae bacterium]|nr:WecB/TagA/CpsF family glycosyltransferase [Muribaculaceae bacterium]
MDTYFNIRYEFHRDSVHSAIDNRLQSKGADYICVADGVILDNANRNPEYLKVVNSGLFSICDSSFVPVYIRLIHGEKRNQYCGAQIFRDIVKSGKYRMAFYGANQAILESLRRNLMEMNPDVKDMMFRELPFLEADQFDYASIASEINADKPDIIWISLGAPKQEYFMHRLRPHLNHGVLIAVGAAFKFYADGTEKRAPDWMVNHHMEFLFRITQEPRKQIRRCRSIIQSLPRLFVHELKQSKRYHITRK